MLSLSNHNTEQPGKSHRGDQMDRLSVFFCFFVCVLVQKCMSFIELKYIAHQRTYMQWLCLCIAAFCAYRVGEQTERTNVQKQSADHVKLIRVPKNVFNFSNSRLTLFDIAIERKKGSLYWRSLYRCCFFVVSGLYYIVFFTGFFV